MIPQITLMSAIIIHGCLVMLIIQPIATDALITISPTQCKQYMFIADQKGTPDNYLDQTEYLQWLNLLTLPTPAFDGATFATLPPSLQNLHTTYAASNPNGIDINGLRPGTTATSPEQLASLEVLCTDAGAAVNEYSTGGAHPGVITTPAAPLTTVAPLIPVGISTTPTPGIIPVSGVVTVAPVPVPATISPGIIPIPTPVPGAATSIPLVPGFTTPAPGIPGIATPVPVVPGVATAAPGVGLADIPKTDLQKCKGNVIISDTNRDMMLDEGEYIAFVNRMSNNAFPQATALVALPAPLQMNFQQLAQTGQIAVVGYLPNQGASPDQLAFLAAVCDATDIAVYQALNPGATTDLTTTSSTTGPVVVTATAPPLLNGTTTTTMPIGIPGFVTATPIITTPATPPPQLQLPVSTLAPQDCKNRMIVADAGSMNNYLSQEEFVKFLNQMSANAYAGQSFVTLPLPLQEVFNMYATSDGGEVSIFGANPAQAAEATPQQVETLNLFCAAVQTVLAGGTATAPGGTSSANNGTAPGNIFDHSGGTTTSGNGNATGLFPTAPPAPVYRPTDDTTYFLTIHSAFSVSVDLPGMAVSASAVPENIRLGIEKAYAAFVDSVVPALLDALNSPPTTTTTTTTAATGTNTTAPIATNLSTAAPVFTTAPLGNGTLGVATTGAFQYPMGNATPAPGINPFTRRLDELEELQLRGSRKLQFPTNATATVTPVAVATMAPVALIGNSTFQTTAIPPAGNASVAPAAPVFANITTAAVTPAPTGPTITTLVLGSSRIIQFQDGMSCEQQQQPTQQPQQRQLQVNNITVPVPVPVPLLPAGNTTAIATTTTLPPPLGNSTVPATSLTPQGNGTIPTALLPGTNNGTILATAAPTTPPPSCLIVFAAYDIQAAEGADKQILYDTLVRNSQLAIENGALQAALVSLMGPFSGVTVVGPYTPVDSSPPPPAPTANTTATSAPLDNGEGGGGMAGAAVGGAIGAIAVLLCCGGSFFAYKKGYCEKCMGDGDSSEKEESERGGRKKANNNAAATDDDNFADEDEDEDEEDSAK